ncbi:iron-sulfur cluster assembly accessory family protein [Orientia chuto str. Dubai]|uniref:Iron-sulfur cluster assembly accessory family protein n=1 Tax=Orientia chuto str. Dubai TaxID=1359168 RepID=A0A0F3MNE9_9RICK|nr:iron-sulfur cluster assembly accessory protein [Candidatus Orientia mediorientalis]KJV57265.1 iron-sulfur cluster assembly accessory family protein [Orientia chuto str. Dubai]
MSSSSQLQVNKASKNVITISDLAAKKIKELLITRGKPSLGIKVGIKPGGCSGHSYYIEYADSKGVFDEVIMDKGVTILIDQKAVLYLLGTTMDYIEGKFSSGFEFNNPNEKSRCGCGKSAQF